MTLISRVVEGFLRHRRRAQGQVLQIIRRFGGRHGNRRQLGYPVGAPGLPGRCGSPQANDRDEHGNNVEVNDARRVRPGKQWEWNHFNN